MLRTLLLTLPLCLAVGCTDSDQPEATSAVIDSVNSRENQFPGYPQPNNTYLTFSKAHGFQVNYIAHNQRSWLWYPGNRKGVPEIYKRDTLGGRPVLCWKHPNNSYNPVTRKQGGNFACEDLGLAQKTVVAYLPGDPFRLASGTVPYRLKRCTAPKAFNFNRAKISC